MTLLRDVNHINEIISEISFQYEKDYVDKLATVSYAADIKKTFLISKFDGERTRTIYVDIFWFLHGGEIVSSTSMEDKNVILLDSNIVESESFNMILYELSSAKKYKCIVDIYASEDDSLLIDNNNSLYLTNVFDILPIMFKAL